MIDQQQFHVLLLTQASYDGRVSGELRSLETLLQQLRCAVTTASSESQALHQLRYQVPCLVIVAEQQSAWIQQMLKFLRQESAGNSPTIVALTEFNSSSWLSQHDNPHFDGLLVRPISKDILTSLLHSASVRQICG